MNQSVDAYPSRNRPTAAIRPRRDPVVYGKRTSGEAALAPALIDRYERDGYLSFESFFERMTIFELSADLERLRRRVAADDPTVIREPESQAVRSIFEVHRRSGAVRRLIRDPRLLQAVEQILGGKVYVHQSRINFKSGFEGEPFYWHSDFETWHMEDGMPRMRAVSAQISLSENTMLNGPLMLIPGSHRHYIACVGATPDDHYKSSLRRQEYGVPDPDNLRWLVAQGGGLAAPVGPVGSMVLFDCNTIHGSNSNITPFSRTNLFVVFNSVENALEEPYGGTKPRPDFIASRQVEPLDPG